MSHRSITSSGETFLADGRPLLFTATALGFLLMIAGFWIGYLGSDDATYARGAYGWLESFPYVGGHGTIREPMTLPLALSFLALGENEFALVLPTLLYALGLFLVMLRWSHAAGGLVPAGLTALLLATSPILVVQSSIASIDVVECFFIIASLFLFWRAATAGPRPGRLLAAGALAGLGFLSRETTVFLLLAYGLLFLAGWGMARRWYWLMAAGFLAVWGIELAYLTAATGDPLYRMSISLNHDSSINRGIDMAGNLIVHPALDPLLAILFNQEFGLLFWVAVPAAVWLWRDVPRRTPLHRAVVLLSVVALVWFVAVAVATRLLPLNPRYFLVSTIAAMPLVGLALARLWRHGLCHAAVVMGGLLVLFNLSCLMVENTQYMFGARTLARVAGSGELVVHTDPVTAHRAEMLLRWNGAADRVSAAPPPTGALYLFNPTWQTGDAAYRPQPAWDVVARYYPDPGPLGRGLRWLGIADRLPEALRIRILQGHPGSVLYRVR